MNSIRCAICVRPMVELELKHKFTNCILADTNMREIVVNGKNNLKFNFNYIFTSKHTQRDIYNVAVNNLVEQLFVGYNVSILTYGQTGSGKTYCMGTNFKNIKEQNGIIQQSIKNIFDKVNRETEGNKYSIKTSFIELYQEHVYDLLTPNKRNLNIKEKGAGICIPNITEISVKNVDATLQCLKKGCRVRATGSTSMNVQSSRSHCIFTLTIDQMQENGNHRTAKFQLVDLAGSESHKKTEAIGKRLQESININKSLLSLGKVITALRKKSSHIPYRESKLTRLLKDSLGGNSLTLLIACISPADYNINETISTLQYAKTALNIKNKPFIKQNITKNQLPATPIENFELKPSNLSPQITNLNEVEPNFEMYHHHQETVQNTLAQNIDRMKTIHVIQKRHIKQQNAVRRKLENEKKKRLLERKNALAVWKSKEKKLLNLINQQQNKIEQLQKENEYNVRQLNEKIKIYNNDTQNIEPLKKNSIQNDQLDFQVIKNNTRFSKLYNIIYYTVIMLLLLCTFYMPTNHKINNINKNNNVYLDITPFCRLFDELNRTNVRQFNKKKTIYNNKTELFEELRENCFQKDKSHSNYQIVKNNTRFSKPNNIYSFNISTNLEVNVNKKDNIYFDDTSFCGLLDELNRTNVRQFNEKKRIYNNETEFFEELREYFFQKDKSPSNYQTVKNNACFLKPNIFSSDIPINLEINDNKTDNVHLDDTLFCGLLDELNRTNVRQFNEKKRKYNNESELFEELRENFFQKNKLLSNYQTVKNNACFLKPNIFSSDIPINLEINDNKTDNVHLDDTLFCGLLDELNRTNVRQFNEKKRIYNNETEHFKELRENFFQKDKSLSNYQTVKNNARFLKPNIFSSDIPINLEINDNKTDNVHLDDTFFCGLLDELNRTNVRQFNEKKRKHNNESELFEEIRENFFQKNKLLSNYQTVKNNACFLKPNIFSSDMPINLEVNDNKTDNVDFHDTHFCGLLDELNRTNSRIIEPFKDHNNRLTIKRKAQDIKIASVLNT